MSNTNYHNRTQTTVNTTRLTNVLLTAVAVTYALGQRLGAAYRANSETINSDVADFYAAAVVGAKQAVELTYQLGVDARRAYEGLDLTLVEVGLAKHHAAFGGLQQRLYAHLVR